MDCQSEVNLANEHSKLALTTRRCPSYRKGDEISGRGWVSKFRVAYIFRRLLESNHAKFGPDWFCFSHIEKYSILYT